MKKIHELCILAKLENGEIDEKSAISPAEEDAGITSGGAGDLPATQGAPQDPTLESDPQNGKWKGAVSWMKLGETVTLSMPVKGSMTLL